MKMSEPRRLHPITAVSNCLKQLKELIVPFIIFIVIGGKKSDGDLYSLIISACAVLFVFISGIVMYLRFTYRLEDGELKIEYGLFVRKKRYIPFERIQSLDFSEGLLHRPFGLVKVKIETASSGSEDAEAVLTAIKKEEAERIQSIISAAKNKGNIDVTSEETVERNTGEIIYQISFKELLLVATTSGGVGVVITAIIALLAKFDQVLPFRRLFKEAEHLVANGIFFMTIVVFLGFLLAWIIATVRAMFQYANFTVKRIDDHLIISRGLIELKQVTVPLNRVQAIVVSENILRQPFHLAQVELENAGGSKVDDHSSKLVLFPMIKTDKMIKLLTKLFTDYKFTNELNRLPKKAFKGYLIRGTILVLPIMAASLYFFHMTGLWSLLLLLLAIYFSVLRFKDAGWELAGKQLTLRSRLFVRESIYMQKNRIQAFTVKQSLFQKRNHLYSVHAAVKSGAGVAGGHIIGVDSSDVKEMYEWYGSTSNKVKLQSVGYSSSPADC